MLSIRNIAAATFAVALGSHTAVGGPIETENKQIELSDETAVVAFVDFGAGSIDIHKGASDLVVDATITYDRKYVEVYVDYARRQSEGRLELASELENRTSLSGHLTNEWDVGFTDRVPLDLTLDVGAAEAQVDLTGLSVKRLSLDVGAAEAEIWWNAVNASELEEIAIECGASSLRIDGLGYANFERLEFEGGVGSFELDFRGPWTRSAQADFEIGLGSLELLIPEDMAVRIEADEAFMSSVDVDRHFRETDDGVYETDNYAGASVRLDIHIEMGMGSVDVRAVRP